MLEFASLNYLILLLIIFGMPYIVVITNTAMLTGWVMLQVSFQGLVKDMLCGELTSVTVNCENCGNVDVTRLLVSCATPNIVSLGRPHSSRGGTREVPLPHPLAPGQSLQVPMQVRAHDVKGSFTIDLFFYYENSLYQVKPL